MAGMWQPGPRIALYRDHPLFETEDTMPRPTPTQAETAAASRATPSQDAIEVLMDDHRAVRKLFDAFEKTKDDDLDAKTTLVRRACEELTVHAMIEEELLYPAAQEALDEDDRPDVEEAYVEHFLVKVLIEKFTTLRAGQPGFDATFKVMSEMVQHHIEEEESDLFPKLRKSSADLNALGKKLMQRKEQLEAKIPKDAGDNTMRLH
jgi:hemerythrin superfamily protein